MEHPAEILRSDHVELRRWCGQDLDILHRLIAKTSTFCTG